MIRSTPYSPFKASRLLPLLLPRTRWRTSLRRAVCKEFNHFGAAWYLGARLACIAVPRAPACANLCRVSPLYAGYSLRYSLCYSYVSMPVSFVFNDLQRLIICIMSNPPYAEPGGYVAGSQHKSLARSSNPAQPAEGKGTPSSVYVPRQLACYCNNI